MYILTTNSFRYNLRNTKYFILYKEIHTVAGFIYFFLIQTRRKTSTTGRKYKRIHSSNCIAYQTR